MQNVMKNIKENWKSGITVSLVSLPLSISLAVAANATPVMGVITAIWAGIFAAILGGSHFNIVGPTGALSGLLATYAILYGVGVLPLLAVLSGIIILLFFVFHIDRYIVFIPSSVVHGFTLGVAFIIALNQLNFALGLKGLTVHEKFFENVLESLKHLSQTSFVAVGLFSISLIVLLLFTKFIKKIPGAIVVAFVGIILGMLTSKGILNFPLQTLATKFGELHPTLAALPHFTSSMVNMEVLKAAFAVALIAILETLISGKIADGMTKTKFDQRKEVMGLGIANIFSGIFGGIPATGALARTALNIKSGATHRTSGIINALMVAVIALFLLPTFKYLPLPIVAAILVHVAIRMIEAEHYSHMFKHDRFAFGLSLVVALVTIVEDPIIGILLGATVALLYFVNQLSKAQTEITVNKNKKVVSRVVGDDVSQIEKLKGDVLVYRFAGQMTYVNAQSHIQMLRQITHAKTLILSFRNLFYIDVDGMDSLEEIIEELMQKNMDVVLTGVSQNILPQFVKTKWFRDLQKKEKVFESTSSALKEMGFHIPTA